MKPLLALIPLALLAGCAQTDPIVGIWLSNDNGFKAGLKDLPGKSETQSAFREFRKDGTWINVLRENTLTAEFYVILEGTWSRQNDQLIITEESGISIPVVGTKAYVPDPAEPSPQLIKTLTPTTLELEAKGRTRNFTRSPSYPAKMDPTIWSTPK